MSVRVRIAHRKPAREGLFGVVKSTYDLYGMDRLSWNETQHGKTPPNTLTMDGVPDAWRIFERATDRPEYIELTENLQHWILRCNLEAVTGHSYTKAQYFEWFENSISKSWYISELNSALRANRYSVNFYGMDNGANYLTGERLDRQKPKWIKILSGWACVLLELETDGTPKKRDIPGAGACYAFQCINVSGDVWQYSPLSHPHLFDLPMVTAREVVNGAIVRDNRHIPFGQMNDLLVFPIMLPADSTAWLPIGQIRITNEYTRKAWIR